MSATVRTLVFDPTGEKVLMVLNEKKQVPRPGSITPKPRGWGLPGGHVADDEELAEAAHRENREEAGIKVILDEENPLKFIQGSDHIVYVFLGTNPEGTFQPQDPDDDILDVDWLDWKLLVPDDSSYGRHKGEKIYNNHIEWIHAFMREKQRI